MQLINVILLAILFGLGSAPFFILPSSLFLCGVVASFAALFLVEKYCLAKSLLCFSFCALLANACYPTLFHHSQNIDFLAGITTKIPWQGGVRNVEYRADGRCSLDVGLQQVEIPETDFELNDSIGVRLYIQDCANHPFLPGEQIALASRFRKPRLFGTPGEFHWSRYLLSQNTYLMSWVKNSDQIKLVQPAEVRPSNYLIDLKYRVAGFLSQHFSASKAMLLRALILGEGKVISSDVRRILGRTGVSHLFAISGLHVGLVGFFLYVCFLRLWKKWPELSFYQPPQRVLPVLVAPFLLGFLVFTGGAIATQRAFLLALLVALMLMCRVHISRLQLIASVATLFLLSNPLLLWNASWQLSFLGTAGILYFAPALCHISNNKVFGYFLQLLGVSVIAFVATLPAVIANFHTFAPFGILVNVVAVPLVTLLALPAGMLGVVCFSFFPVIAMGCFWLSGSVLELTVAFCRWFNNFELLSGKYLFLSRPQLLAVCLVLCALILFMQWQQKKLRYLAVVFISVAPLVWPLNESRPTGPAMTLISVGQGDAILLQAGQGKAVLVDGGGLYSDTFDVGERLVAPALGVLGVDSLEAVILTHDHPDHRKGLPFVLANFPVKSFYARQSRVNLHPSLAKTLQSKSIPLVNPPVGWSTLQFGDTLIKIFRQRDHGLSENDASLVLKWELGSAGNVLLTGDLESRGVVNLLAESPGQVAILKLPHHGSRFSNIEQLVDVTKPEICMVSSGYNNRYRLPAQSVVDNLNNKHIPLLRTDHDGTVRARWEEGTWIAESWVNGLFR